MCGTTTCIAQGIAVVSLTKCFANGQFANVVSQLANELCDSLVAMIV